MVSDVDYWPYMSLLLGVATTIVVYAVNDILYFFQGDLDNFNDLHNYINSIHDNLKFTLELEQENTLWTLENLPNQVPLFHSIATILLNIN